MNDEQTKKIEDALNRIYYVLCAMGAFLFIIAINIGGST